MPPAERTPPAPALPSVDLVVAASRGRTALIAGFLAGVGVFFAPLVVLALGLLAAYLGYISSDGSTPLWRAGRPLEATDFRAVFAPAVNEFPLLLCAGLMGAALGAFRRWLAQRTDPARLAAGSRPFFPEFALLYVLLAGLTVALAFIRGGPPQVHRLLGAAPVFLLFLLCATWLAHAVWHYCFRNIVSLLASEPERDAATALRHHIRSHRFGGNRVW
jgi:hypothetical protein